MTRGGGGVAYARCLRLLMLVYTILRHSMAAGFDDTPEKRNESYLLKWNVNFRFFVRFSLLSREEIVMHLG